MQLLAACQKAPTVQPPRREVDRGGLRLQPARPCAVHRGHRRQGAAARAAGARTRSRSRDTSAGSPGAVPTSTSRCCASRTSSGRDIRTALTDYFSLPVVPTVLGFDGRLQFVHEDDGLEALRLATTGPTTGIVNVAGDGVLMLSQAARLAGRPALPVPPALSAWRTRCSAAPASPTSPPTRSGSSPTAAPSTPPGCAATSASSPATPPGRPSPTSSAARRLHGPLSPDVVQSAEERLLAGLRGLVPSGEAS